MRITCYYGLCCVVKNMSSQQERNVITVFVDRPTNRTGVAEGLLSHGFGCRAVAQTHPAFPKMPQAPSAFPYKCAPQAPGDKPSPEEEIRAWGTALWGSRYVSLETWHTRPDPYRWYYGRPIHWIQLIELTQQPAVSSLKLLAHYPYRFLGSQSGISSSGWHGEQEGLFNFILFVWFIVVVGRGFKGLYYLTQLFFFLPHLTRRLLCKRLQKNLRKEGREKTRIPFKFQLYFKR